MPARAASGKARGSSKHSSGKPRTPSERCQELGDEADLGRDGIPLLGRRAGGELWIYVGGCDNEMPARAASRVTRRSLGIITGPDLGARKHKPFQEKTQVEPAEVRSTPAESRGPVPNDG